MGFFQARVLQWGAIALSSQCPLDPSNSDKGGQALLLPLALGGPRLLIQRALYYWRSEQGFWMPRAAFLPKSAQAATTAAVAAAAPGTQHKPQDAFLGPEVGNQVIPFRR